MELLPFFILAALFTSVVLFYFWYADLSFSFTHENRRFRYQRRLPDETVFETRGSGYFKTPTIKVIAQIPYYPGDPVRRVYDDRKNEVVYETKD